ncbi:MAG TPA: DinB family protein [Vicinamibacteria bacterium]|nr:DinB family protein [Vicinamibacteria bacterium]
MSELARDVIEEARFRTVEGFPAQVRAALESMSDEEIWRRPSPKGNSVGHLVLHLIGSTRLFLGRAVGGSDFVRDRPGEFAFAEMLPRQELLRRLDETLAEAQAVFAAVTPERLLATTERAPGGPYTVLALLLRVSHHWAAHTGQIVYVAKCGREGAVDELWQKTMKGR